MCWQRVLQSFPQLDKVVDFKELLPACEQKIEEFPNLSVTFYPVFHGESALGAGMLLFKYQNEKKLLKALFTGDLLCPLLRKKDYEELIGCDVLYVDSNNRLPYPSTNHWSIARPEHLNKPGSTIFIDWYNQKGGNLSWLCRPNTPVEFTPEIHNYLSDFVKEQLVENNIPYTIFDFEKIIRPKHVNLVHYSGKQDEQYSELEILNEQELKKWTNESAIKIGINTKFIVPKVGDEFEWA